MISSRFFSILLNNFLASIYVHNLSFLSGLCSFFSNSNFLCDLFICSLVAALAFAHQIFYTRCLNYDVVNEFFSKGKHVMKNIFF